jgi:cytochrome b561
MAPSDSGSSSAVAYTRTAIALHWLLAVAFAAQVVLGWWMLDLPKTPPGLRAGWFNVHKTIGITVGLLVLVRITWRATHVPPRAGTGGWERIAAQAAHGALYACMLLMPLTGFLGSSFTRYPIRYFGRALPTPHADWPMAKQLMSDFHYATAWALMVLVAIHVAAAAWHWWRRDAVAARMGIPSWR